MSLRCGFVCVIFFINFLDLSQGGELQECVMQQKATYCYYCDSKFNPSCGDPFKFSYYFFQTDIYLTECMGCCIKITYPREADGSRRIVRTCTESLPRALNISLEDNCYSRDPNEHRVCLCTSAELCNTSTSIESPQIIVLTLFTVVSCFIGSLSI